MGEWFDYWEETGNPLCITIHTDNDQILKLFSSECENQGFSKPEIFKDTNWLTSKISLDNNENIVGLITEKIKNIVDKLKIMSTQQNQ